MIYYIVKGHIFTVFLSMLHLTSVSFPQKITGYVGGQKGDFQIHEMNKAQSLVFEPKNKGFKRNLVAFSKNARYHFNLSYNEQHSNQDIELRQAKPCTHFKLLRETKAFQLFECPKSLFFINKRAVPVNVNGIFIRDKGYLSKGPPLFLNHKMIYYQGRFL